MRVVAAAVVTNLVKVRASNHQCMEGVHAAGRANAWSPSK